MPGPKAQILIVDDDKDICSMLYRLLAKEGFTPFSVYDGQSALEAVMKISPDVMLVDNVMPGMNGTELMGHIREKDPDLPVIMITAYSKIRGAVEAIRAGAYDYLAKPFEHQEVINVIRRALGDRARKKKLENLCGQLEDNLSLTKMMGPSDAIIQLVSKVNRVAQSDFTVVMQGETGTGKELVAGAIHHASRRSAGPFIAVDCGAIPETLLESELFGHEKGAFTGAVVQKPGKMELANSGTLFLDEISNMPLASQVKLLRMLQEKQIYRVGGTKPVSMDVRLLVASNKDLEAEIAASSFRSDLFYRLNEFIIKIPPLRERKEDIAYLEQRFLDLTNIELGKQVRGFSDSAMQILRSYDWPGNVRELRSVIRRAVLLAEDMIMEKHLDICQNFIPDCHFTPMIQIKGWEDLSLKKIVRQNTDAVEREMLSLALKRTGGNKAKAARLLQIDYKTIHTKLRQLGISPNGGLDG